MLVGLSVKTMMMLQFPISCVVTLARMSVIIQTNGSHHKMLD